MAQVQAQHLEEKYQQTLLRLEKLKLEHESISVNQLQEAEKLQEQRIKLIADQEFDECQLSQSKENAEQLRTKLQEIEQQLHGVQDNFHRTNTEYAALTAAQRAARQGEK